MMKCMILGLAVALAVVGCGKQGGKSSEEATLDDLSRALAVMSMGGARRPANVSDLTNFPSLRGKICLLYTSPSPRDRTRSRMPSSA